MNKLPKLERAISLAEKYEKRRRYGTITDLEYKETLLKLATELKLTVENFEKVSKVYCDKMCEENPDWEPPFVSEADQILKQYEDKINKSKEKKEKSKVSINEKGFEKLINKRNKEMAKTNKKRSK